MIARLASAFALSAALALPAAAQDAAPDAQALAEQYVALPGVQQMMTDMFSPEAVMAQMMAAMPPDATLTQDQQDRIGALMSERLGALRPSMEAAMVSASAQTFTPEELQAMNDFYGSEVGASILAKTQPMMAQVMGQIGPEMQAAQQAVIPEVMAIMQEGQ